MLTEFDGIEICNLRTEKTAHPYDFTVDRGSVLGNPFVMHSESERDEVCDKYEKWFMEHKKDKNLRVFLAEMVSVYKKYSRIRLFCWCVPKRCHAQTIAKFIYLFSKYEESSKEKI